LTLLSPGWMATVSSPDGMHAYQLQRTPNLLVSQNGKVVQLKVEGF
jgi:intracellular multiplication protein IcmK